MSEHTKLLKACRELREEFATAVQVIATAKNPDVLAEFVRQLKAKAEGK
jgi:hypothetical protein